MKVLDSLKSFSDVGEDGDYLKFNLFFFEISGFSILTNGSKTKYYKLFFRTLVGSFWLFTIWDVANNLNNYSQLSMNINTSAADFNGIIRLVCMVRNSGLI